MSNDIIQRIHDKTNGGLDIILDLYPQAERCINNKRHFKIVNEKTASAILSRLDNGTYWVKCFSSGFSGGAVNLYAFTEGRTVKEAIKELGARYGAFETGIVPEAAKPIIEKRPATELEMPGTYSFQFKSEITETELQTIFARKVMDFVRYAHKDWKLHLNKVCAGLGVFALTSFTYIKDNVAIVTKATETYPIFVIKGDGFEKIYQPKSLDKAFRFRYSGEKPADFIFGLKRFDAVFQEAEKKWEEQKDYDLEEATGKRKIKAFKLDEVIICSGDADALNVAALGYNVVWMNAEGSMLPWDVWLHLRKQAHQVYNLPDIDTTGHQEAHKKALRYFELKTIQLPAELYLRKDWRGNPCKDVRDYLKYYDKKAFDTLVKSALEYKFWDEETTYDKEGNPKGTIYAFNDVRAYNFIMKCGFYRFASKSAKTGYEFIRIKDNVVSVIKAKQIKEFVIDFLKEHFPDNQKLRNTMLRTNRLKEDSLDNLDYIEIDFKYYDKGYQYFYFKNRTWEVSLSGIRELRNGDVKKLVWDRKVIQQNVKQLEPSFTTKIITQADGTETLDIDIHNYDCPFFRYLVNASRVYWRTELEERCDEKYSTEEERSAYRQRNKFRIDGELLTEEEKAEQKQHLVNKLFFIGYSICRFKNPSKAWAPFVMDHKLSAEGESHGGSGKSLMVTSLGHVINPVVIDGKSKSLLDDKFAFENVTEATEAILVDDLDRHTPIEPFFPMITGFMTINPKWGNRFTIPFEHSPKIIFTSNYGVRNLGPSAERRLVYSAFSDYYHNNLNKNYREDRTVFDDFGKDLFQDFTEQEWNLFFNTVARCYQTYLMYPYKLNPPMDNVVKRNLMSIMGDSFFNWADIYFSLEGGRLDQLIPRQEAFNDYIRNNNIKHYSTQRFSASLEAWCKYYQFEFNPKELKNKSGRVIAKALKRNPDGSTIKTIKPGGNGTFREVEEKIATEMIYIKTKTNVPVQEDLFGEVET